MGKSLSKHSKERREKACAQCFIDWYNERNLTAYRLRRAEEAFYELDHETRWDFVAVQGRNLGHWLAIEVKRLIRPNLRRQFSDWNRLIQAVTRDIVGKHPNALTGTFQLVPGVAQRLCGLGAKKLSQLKRVLEQVIPESVKGMEMRTWADLGPAILQKFPEWPHTDHLQMHPQPHIVKRADKLPVYKMSNGGKQIEVPTAVDAFSSREAEKEASSLLFGGEKGSLAKANRQLGIAKQRHAYKTILLLDRCLDSRMHLAVVKQALLSDPNAISNVDAVYLVDIRQNKVVLVWLGEEDDFQ